jgi:lysyl-tRNA synthetase class 2
MREDIVEARKEKLEFLKKSGIDPYPEKNNRDTLISVLHEGFDDFLEHNDEVTVVGRVRSLRVMGKIAFAHIEDESGKIQVFFEKDVLEERFEIFKKSIDLGDFVEVFGTVFLTKKEERTIRVSSWNILSKSLRPIPTEHFGIKDEEELLRKRYLDFIVNPDHRKLFVKKNIFWQTVRTFLADRGFLEAQTSVLEHVPGGAEAEPFITHYNALDQDLYLRISLELALKRMLVGGFEKVFEIGRVFRNEGMSREHLQEFDHMEFYWAYTDMNDGMKMVEEMYKLIVYNVTRSMKTQYGDHTIDWEGDWKRVDFYEAFEKETGINLSEDVSVGDLQKKARELGISFEKTDGKGRLIDTIYKKTVRVKLIQPCFLVGHPLEVSPLAKTDPNNPGRTLRFQPVAVGSELGNGFSELNDPIEQRRRFEEQMKLREAGDNEAQMIDEDFLEALEYGMPPACGFGMSERLFAILLDKSIRETVVFPPARER